MSWIKEKADAEFNSKMKIRQCFPFDVIFLMYKNL